jgi:hypothetical protein
MPSIVLRLGVMVAFGAFVLSRAKSVSKSQAPTPPVPPTDQNSMTMSDTTRGVVRAASR